MLKTFSLMVALATVPGAFAQSTDAARYTNGQGVEIIQNRPIPAQVAPSAMPAMKEPAAKPATLTQPKAAREEASIRDARFQVSSQDQAARDRDRANILRQELVKELEDFETKNKVLRNPKMKAGLDDEQLKRLQETLQVHERNIRDLNAEITRTTRQ